jgi:hypothetical protein
MTPRRFAFLLLFLFSAYCHAAEVTLFMAVNGTGDGSSPSSPLGTLQQAQSKVSSIWATEPLTPVVVKIAPGTFIGQYIDWTTVNKSASLTFEAQDPLSPPVFDGQGKVANTFFKLNYAGGKSNLVFRGLHIKRYLSAIQFYADRENFARNNSDNEITDCIFEEIGNAYWASDTVPDAYSAINLVNSDFNKIRGNTFKKIRNSKGGILLHSIYLAHNSNNNDVADNHFEDVTGSFIRLRDYSNANAVSKNDFTRADTSVVAVDTWYCVEPFEDANGDGIDDVTKCTKTNAECPSIDNTVYKNSYSATSTFFAEHVGYDAGQTDCRIAIPAINNQVQQNVDVTSGRCLIRSMRGCAAFGLPAQTFVQDYLSQEAQGSSSVCASRAQAYYGSCTSRSGDLNDVMTTRMQATTPGLYDDAHYGSGCLTQTQNCPRMSMPDRVDVLDTGTNAQSDKNVCLQRNTTWYSSCSRDDPTGNRFNRQKYITGKVEEVVAAGQGCVIYATFCPRMGIEENGFRMDTQTATQTDSAACLARAPSWWSSCTANLTNPSAVTVEARFYQNGKLTSARKYP